MRLTVISVSLLLFFSACREYPLPEYKSLDFKVHESNGLYIPDEWQAELWAESPDFYNPTNIDVDRKGRIWVVEAVNYRDFNNKGEEYLYHKKGDRVVILEDSDGDGKADKTTVFVQDSLLVAPMGIGVIGNKVYVSSSPNLIVYTDENGDDKPDKREVFLTGFGGYDHDHSLHALLGGPDGKFYFNTGNAGPHTVSDKAGWTLKSGSIYTGGTPYNRENSGNRVSDDGKVWVGGLALRINRDGTGLKVMGHNFRNAYELALDSYGNMWQNDNDDGVLTCRFTWLMEGGNAGFFSEDGTRTWQNERRPHQSNFTAHWHQEDPGVIPAGDNTGAGAPTGVVVYEGDHFGEKYRGMVLSADAGRNTIFGYKPRPIGAGFELNRTNIITSVEEQDDNYIWHDFPEEKSKWFRPSDMAIGTDGAIYVADWYDPIVGGHQMRESRGMGKIYRITPKNADLTSPNLDFSTIEGAVEGLKSPAVNVRFSAFTQLVEFGEEAVWEVSELLYHWNPYVQARAVWLLTNLGEKGMKIVKGLNDHPNEQIRVTAIRAMARKMSSKEFINYVSPFVNDGSDAVKRSVLTSLADIDDKDKRDIIIEMAGDFNGTDPWYLEALAQAAEGLNIWPDIQEKYGAPALQWDERLEGMAWRFHPVELVGDFELRANAEELDIDKRKRAVVALAFINDLKAVEAMERLTKSALPDVARHAAWWMQFRKTNEWYALKEWEDGENAASNTLNIERSVSKYDMEKLLTVQGSSSSGKDIFDSNCKSCHRFKDEGTTIGPNLTRIKSKYGKEDLLLSIIDPDSGIQFGYEPWEIKTHDGNTYFGFLQSDGNTVVLKDITGKNITLDKDDVKSKKQLEKSIMPDAGSLGLDEKALADLAAFLLK